MSEDFRENTGQIQGAMEQCRSRWVVVNYVSLPIKCNHAIGHMQKQGRQLIPFVFRFPKSGPKDIGHVVKATGQIPDFIVAGDGNRISKVTGGNLARTGRQRPNGGNQNLCQQDRKGNADDKA